MSDLDLILRILKEEIQVSDNLVEYMPFTESTVDGISFSKDDGIRRGILTRKRKRVKNPETGKMQIQDVEEIASAYQGKYKLDNTDPNRVVPVPQGETMRRKKAQVNPDDSKKYSKIKDYIGIQTPTQKGRNRKSLESLSAKVDRLKAQYNDKNL